jgi:hypothetical protein
MVAQPVQEGTRRFEMDDAIKALKPGERMSMPWDE